MRFSVLSLLIIFILGCQSPRLPKERLLQYTYSTSYAFKPDGLDVQIANSLYCPLRVWIQSPDSLLMDRFSELNPVLLPPLGDTTMHFGGIVQEAEVQFASRLGDTTKQVQSIQLELPFPAGRTYTIIQGNNTSFTHNTDYSRYAIDFDLSKRDTVCAAHSGYVVGVIEGYKYGSKEPKWRDYANYITLYAPEAGIFTQYGHLDHNGSFVEVGDWVEEGMPIGLSGLTGQTTVEHLHFNSLVPAHSNAGLRSVPSHFKEGIKGEKLKKRDTVRKKR